MVRGEQAEPTDKHVRPVGIGVGIGLYWAWILIACFSDLLFDDSIAMTEVVGFSQRYSFVGYIFVLCLTAIVMRRVDVSWTHMRATTISIISCIGTLMIAFSTSIAEPAAAESLIYLGAILTGLGTGVFLLSWGYLYACSRAYEPRQIALALLVCAIVFAVVSVLPFGARGIIAALLPLVSGACCYSASISMGQPVVDLRVSPESTFRYPRKLIAGLMSIGIVFGTVLGLSFDGRLNGTDLSIVCAVIDLVLAAVIFGYDRCMKRNLGFSTPASLIVVILAAAGMLVLLGWQGSYLLLVVLLVRGAYSLVDMIIWLQLPRIYALGGDIRPFVVSRVALEGGAFLGTVIIALTVSFLEFAVPVVLLLEAVFLVGALSLVYSSGDASGAWGLVPTVAPPGRGHRLQEACRVIAERYGLTKRESEIMTLLLRGNNGPFIQEKLCISQNTFQTHMRNLYHKCDIHSRQELLVLLDGEMDVKKSGE